MNELQEHVRVRAPDQARERERERGRRKEGASNRRQSAACKVANHGARERELVTEPVKGDSLLLSDPRTHGRADGRRADEQHAMEKDNESTDRLTAGSAFSKHF